MKKILVLLFTLVAMFTMSRTASAQQGDPSRNYDFQAPLYTVVDLASKPYFGGWSGDCNSGRAPSSIALWRIDGFQAVNISVTVSYGPRADAAAWLAATCNRPFDVNVGWSIVPNEPQPAGTFIYVVKVDDIPTSWVCKTMPPGYPNSGQVVCEYASNAVYRKVSE